MTSVGSPEVLDVEQFLARHEQQELLRLVVVGSVDDGKSTLIGRLLYETHSLFEDQISQVRRASRRAVAEGEVDFSLFTDGLCAEREQGITIDVAYRSFSTPRRRFIIADTPGHVQYTRNMATGASTADLAVILLDARLGVLPQSQRHARIASLMGISRLAVAVNKMDLVDFDSRVFETLKARFSECAAGLGFEHTAFFPISAALGDNIIRRSDRMPWHTGTALLEFLETVPLPQQSEAAPFRFPVQYVLRPDLDYRAFAGQVASGVIHPGDEVQVLPAGRTARVVAIDTFEGQVSRAFAPMSVALRLSEPLDISRGDLIVRPEDPPRVRRRVEARMVWLNERPLDPERRYLLKSSTRTVPAQVTGIAWRTDPETLEPIPAERLEMNDIGRVTLSCQRPILCDPYAANRGTGAFILIDPVTNDTVAAGVVEEDALGPEKELERSGEAASQVTPKERQERLGHPGALVFLSASAALAHQLERALFDRGFVSTVAPNAEAAIACAVAGLVAVCVSEADPRDQDRALAQLRASGEPMLDLSGESDLTRAVERVSKRLRRQ